MQTMLKTAKELTDKQIVGIAASATSIGVGAKQIGKAYHSGAFTGKETLWHATDASNVKNIKAEGLKSKFATDPTNLTNTILKDVPMSKKKGKVYLARDKRMAKVIRTNARVKSLLGLGESKKILKVKISLDDVAKK